MFDALPVRTKRDHSLHKACEDLRPAVQNRFHQYSKEMWMVSNVMVGFARTIHVLLHRPGGPLPKMLADVKDFDRDFLQSDYHQPVSPSSTQRSLASARRVISDATLSQKYDVTYCLQDAWAGAYEEAYGQGTRIFYSPLTHHQHYRRDEYTQLVNDTLL
ncbi:hypothetical protein LTR27_012047 [Elasticomyces elasticus]|nr:hypothetical protein LTR27_012047 [Elasticomyces elasticus]